MASVARDGHQIAEIHLPRRRPRRPDPGASQPILVVASAGPLGDAHEYRFHGIVQPAGRGKNHDVDLRKGGGVNLRNFMRDETGQGLVEYALIIAVIAVAVIVAMLFLRDQLTNVFSNIGNNLT